MATEKNEKKWITQTNIGGEIFNFQDDEAYHGTVGDGIITIAQNGSTVGSFSTNQSNNTSISLNVISATLGYEEVE